MPRSGVPDVPEWAYSLVCQLIEARPGAAGAQVTKFTVDIDGVAMKRDRAASRLSVAQAPVGTADDAAKWITRHRTRDVQTGWYQVKGSVRSVRVGYPFNVSVLIQVIRNAEGRRPTSVVLVDAFARRRPTPAEDTDPLPLTSEEHFIAVGLERRDESKTTKRHIKEPAGALLNVAAGENMK